MICGINLLDKFQIRLEMNRSCEGVKAIKYLNEINCDRKEIREVTNDIKRRNITKEYDSIIMKHKWKIGKTNLVKYEIITNSKPIVVNPRRQTNHLVKKIE